MYNQKRGEAISRAETKTETQRGNKMPKLNEKTAVIRVVYWAGTREVEGFANTYQSALRIAGKNQNAHGPTFYDTSTGKVLFDDGNGLCDESQTYYAV